MSEQQPENVTNEDQREEDLTGDENLTGVVGEEYPDTDAQDNDEAAPEADGNADS